MCWHIQHLCNISQIQHVISPKPIKTESSKFIKNMATEFKKSQYFRAEL